MALPNFRILSPQTLPETFLVVPSLLEERVWSKVAKKGGDQTSCWEWQGSKTGGYGVVWWGRRREYVHRIVYRSCVGPILPGYQVMHLCNNPACCRPEHLHCGTPADNAAHRDHTTRKQTIIHTPEP